MTWTRRFTRGLVWWSDVCNLKNVCPLWAVTVFWSGLTVNVIGLPCLAKVFYEASVFNGDLNQWDVVGVTTTQFSKCENDLTWRELMLLWLECLVGGLGWWCCVEECGILKHRIPEHAIVIQGGGSLGGLVWWSDVRYLKNVCLFWVVAVLWSGFFRLFFLRVDCEWNRPSLSCDSVFLCFHIQRRP